MKLQILNDAKKKCIFRFISSLTFNEVKKKINSSLEKYIIVNLLSSFSQRERESRIQKFFFLISRKKYYIKRT